MPDAFVDITHANSLPFWNRGNILVISECSGDIGDGGGSGVAVISCVDIVCDGSGDEGWGMAGVVATKTPGSTMVSVTDDADTMATPALVEPPATEQLWQQG